MSDILEENPFIKEGYQFTTHGMTITDVAIFLFAGITGDEHPAHVDDIYAKNSIFGKRVAHGLLTLSVVQGLLSKMPGIPEFVKALLGLDNVRFLKPVYPGDTIRARGEVISVKTSNKNPQNKIVKIKMTGFNQNGEDVITYEVTLLF